MKSTDERPTEMPGINKQHDDHHQQQVLRLRPGDQVTSINCQCAKLLATFVFIISVILPGQWTCAAQTTHSPKWTSTSILPPAFESDLLTSNITNCVWNYCQGNLSKTRCTCDKNCWQERTCCMDFWQQTEKDHNNSSTSAFSSSPFALVDQILNVDEDRRYCRQILVEWEPVKKKYSHFLMIASCPTSPKGFVFKQDEESSLKNARTSCESNADKDFLLRVPVYSHDTNITYKNIFCAVCNNDTHHIEYWNATFKCPKHYSVQNMSDAIANTGCGLELLPPLEQQRDNMYKKTCKFNTNAVSTCNPTWKIPGEPVATRRVRNLCKVIDAEVTIDRRKTYRNVYCALCNNITKSSLVTCNEPKASMCNYPCLTLAAKQQIKSFTVLFDVDYRFQGEIVGVTTLCNEGELYDPFRQQCRTVYCSPPYHFEGDRCVKSQDNDNTSSNNLPDSILKSLLSCPRIVMSVNQSDIYVDANKSLVIRKTSQRFTTGNYEYNNGTLVLCADLSQNFVSRLPGAVFEGLSIAGLSLSLVALALKMFLYFAIPEVRTFPDKIVFCLSVSLFVAQLLFVSGLTASTNYELCATIGLVLHYAFLSTFCWMSALAYDVCCTFANVEAPFLKAQSNNCRFVKYSMFAWVTPSLVVFVASIFDWTPIELPPFSPFRPYYGQALCFISSRHALLVYFVGPVAILLGVIIVLFMITAWNICLSSRQTAVAQRAAQSSASVCHRSKGSTSMAKAHHLNFCLYLKLGVILGLTWISGFVAAYSDLQALWYIYVILNTLQGVYILLAFTPFRKVKRCVQRHVQHKVFYRSHAPTSDTSHKPLQRSSTRSSQTTTISSLSTQRTSFLSSIIKE